MRLDTQKWMIMGGLACINVLLISTFIRYMNDYWMIYIVLLAPTTIIYSIFVIIITLRKTLSSKGRTSPANYVYIVPCYNETREEITEALDSLIDQRIFQGDQRALMIICDGNKGTETALLQILSAISSRSEEYVYDIIGDNRTSRMATAKVWTGEYKDIPYILISKGTNLGKRDSLVIARREIFNRTGTSPVQKYLKSVFSDEAVLYIIGIDGDTIFNHNCSYELIRTMQNRPDSIGCVGLVEISNKSSTWNPLVMFQKAEYLIGQCLKRQAQSITGKVNCLSGCNQILRVSSETCGDEILRVFNRLPIEGESIFSNIRYYASEDRNHVCLMMSMYPESKSVQCLKAVCYTRVPESLSIFSSQRRRWTLGAISNDMLLVSMKNIHPWERLVAAVSIFIHCITPFVIVATAVFLSVLFTAPTYLMLYLAISMIIPLAFYIFAIPMTVILCTPYYYLCLFIYITIGWFLSLWCYCKTLWTMDLVTWGKTQQRKRVNDVSTHDFWMDDDTLAAPTPPVSKSMYIVI